MPGYDLTWIVIQREELGDGRYRIIRPIKRGQSSEVLEAIGTADNKFERRVAIKKLRPFEGDSEALARAFLDEAKLSIQLRHANLVGVIDFGVKDERPYLVLEYVDGSDLDELDALAKEAGAPM